MRREFRNRISTQFPLMVDKEEPEVQRELWCGNLKVKANLEDLDGLEWDNNHPKMRENRSDVTLGSVDAHSHADAMVIS